MRIAFVLNRYPSLTETFIARDINALRQHGLQVEIFALHAGAGARPIALPPRLSGHWLRGAWEKMAGSERTHYFKTVGAQWWHTLDERARQFDHIHAGWASHPALIAWGAAEAANLPWSFSGHARDLFVEGGDLAGKLTSARFASVCTHAGAEKLRCMSPEISENADKIIYAPHGIDAGSIAFREYVPFRPFQILAVGRMVEKKGFDVLLEALAHLQHDKFHFQAQLLGEGPLRWQLIEQSRKLALSECVSFPGAMKQSEVLEQMQQSSCLVVPSRVAADGDRDGLPNVLLEAAACGLPLVATRAGAIGEFVDEETGWLCNADDARDLAATLRSVVADPDLSRSRCLEARQRVETHFDLHRNAQALAHAFSVQRH